MCDLRLLGVRVCSVIVQFRLWASFKFIITDYRNPTLCISEKMLQLLLDFSLGKKGLIKFSRVISEKEYTLILFCLVCFCFLLAKKSILTFQFIHSTCALMDHIEL